MHCFLLQCLIILHLTMYVEGTKVNDKVIVFNVTINTISSSMVEEIGVPGENRRLSQVTEQTI